MIADPEILPLAVAWRQVVLPQVQAQEMTLHVVVEMELTKTHNKAFVIDVVREPLPRVLRGRWRI